MPTSASFVQHSLELLSGVGPVRSRPMFGGHGLSLNGISIGIIDDDRLYLRVDDLTRPQFEEAGAQPFTYPSKKGPMVMKSYWSLPDEAVDDPDAALKWGRLAEEASIRGEAARRKAAPSASKAPGGKTGGKPSSPKAGPNKVSSATSASTRATLPAREKEPVVKKSASKRPTAVKGNRESAVGPSAPKPRSTAEKASRKSAVKTSAPKPRSAAAAKGSRKSAGVRSGPERPRGRCGSLSRAGSFRPLACLITSSERREG